MPPWLDLLAAPLCNRKQPRTAVSVTASNRAPLY
jgi:hypothetical protein